MRDYRIKETEERLCINWRYIPGTYMWPIFLVIPIILAAGYCWAVPGILGFQKVIQNPQPGMILLVMFIFSVCVMLACVIVFFLFYKESIELDHNGLTLEKRVLWLVWKCYFPLCDLQSFDYSFTISRRVTYFIRIVSVTGEFRFGMGWNEDDMQSLCRLLSRYFEDGS